MTYHSSVLLKPSVDALSIKEGGVYIDATFGGGGHSKEILSRMGEGELYGFDQDEDALKNALDDERFVLIHSNFAEMEKELKLFQVDEVDGVLADLGVSSHQFDDEKRGFSIRFDEKLDMRMGKKINKSAHDVLNSYDADALFEVFRNYSDLPRPARIGRAIERAAQEGKMNTTGDLMKALESFPEHNKHHKFFAQVFQAVRMEVNSEVEVLRSFLEQASKLLKPGGKLVVISYHSIEDRLVKQFMKTGNFEGVVETDLFGRSNAPLKMISRKPIIPSEEEIKVNNRARSAKMRIAAKL
jgi:16S rRNA (cytosine1402-N4)-methyltransferase